MSLRSLATRHARVLSYALGAGVVLGVVALGETADDQRILGALYVVQLTVAALTFGLLAWQATHIPPQRTAGWKIRYLVLLVGFVVVSNVGFLRVAHALGADFVSAATFDAENVIDRLYLCVTTLARLGLGEVTPANPEARLVILVQLAFVPSLLLSAIVVELRKWLGNDAD